MTATAENNGQRDRLQRALWALQEMRAKLDELKRARSEPVAIIGVGCRFPGGANNPDQFWHLLENKRDTITEVPPQRWDIEAYYDPDPAAVGKMLTRCGGFLDQVDLFDPQFFGISPREAVSLDPQQRLLLEVAWESLEHAGLAPNRLLGSRTGVFVGISSGEYAELLTSIGPGGIDSYMGSGNAHSVAAGRLSYGLGLEGPSVAIDTACSSSLVAVHLACQSLRTLECELALAGGVNVMLTPTIGINHSRARMLAPDGRCKTFDAAADGFVRSEGCGLVVLKRLSQALADRDNVLAVIRGTAVNQDGHTSGLTVPSGPSQQTVIRQALNNAGCEPSDVSYVEAHGTGTSLGDPIELNALAAVFGKHRAKQRPLVVGSVKTNIGHAEAAAGIAGLIKVVLSLQHEAIPPHLHFQQPNPLVAWDELPFLVPGKVVPWNSGDEPRIAGVSSFGFGGTNAHIVVSEPPVSTPEETAAERPLQLLTLSAQSDEALKQVAGIYERHLAERPELSLGDVCHTANSGRVHFRYRLSIIADSIANLRFKLSAFAAGRQTTGLAHGQAHAANPPIAFLFTGQGSHYLGMGRELYESQPIFRKNMQLCDRLLQPYLPRPLLDVVYATKEADSPLDETVYTQPALFSLEYSLAQLWKSWGVVPGAALGHSVGEYVAACLAGIFSLEDAVKLIASRARLMQALPREGAMAAVLSSEHDVRSVITDLAPDVAIAAINGPRHVVISGRRQSIERLLDKFHADGIETRPLNVSHAFHSALIEPMLAEFARVAESVIFSPPQLDLVLNVTGKLAGSEVAELGYWQRQARSAVRFADGMQTLEQQGYELFVEVGPQPTLLAMGRRCLSEQRCQWLPSLRKGVGDWQVMLESLAALYLQGARVDWQSFDDGYKYRHCDLPTYPFQRRRYWFNSEQTATGGALPLGAGNQHSHPLLGRQLNLARHPGEVLFENQLSSRQPAFLDDHRVFGAAIMPAAGYVEMALAAGDTALRLQHAVLENIVFQQALVLSEDKDRQVQLFLNSDDSGGATFEIYSHVDESPHADATAWTLHAAGTLRVDVDQAPPPREDLKAMQERIAEPLEVERFYESYRSHGVDFGPAFRAVDKVWRGNGEALARIQLPDEAAVGKEAYRLHPVLLDACAQVLGAALPDTQETYLQASIQRLRLYRGASDKLWGHAKLRAEDQRADLRLLDETGEVVAEIIGQEARRVKAELLLQNVNASSRGEFYELVWLPRPRSNLATSHLPAPNIIADKLHPLLELALSQQQVVEFGDALDGLESLVAPYVAQAFTQLGWSFRPQERFSTADLQAVLGIAEPHARLLPRLLEILADEGLLHRIGQQWEVVSDLPAERTCAFFDDASQKYSAVRAELTMLDRCGSQLADVLAGRCDPLQLIFPDGDLGAASVIYDSPGAVAMNVLLRNAIARALEGWPADRPLRVLEIGAGTGGTSRYVLPALPPGHTEYVFTDISRRFLREARAKFSEYSFVQYEILDIEQAPAEQGFADRRFDLVIASNVLHATRNLRQAVEHIRQLLLPGGLLLLLENTAPAKWVDLIWGLTAGWWRFDDDELRPSYPLLSSSQWRELLDASGFASAASVAVDPQQHDALSKQALLVAQNVNDQPNTAAEAHWLILADAGGLGEQVAVLLEARGARSVLAYQAETFARQSDSVFRINPAAARDFKQLLRQVRGSDNQPLRGVMHLWSLDATETDELTTAALCADSLKISSSVVHLIQALSANNQPNPAPLWLITRAAQPVDGEERRLQLAQATTWGIGKVIALEHSESWGGMLDLDAEPNAEDAALLLAEVCDSDGEDHVAFRSGQRFVARLARCYPSLQPARPMRADGTYLITGGFGGLGLQTARCLVDRGARHVALLARNGPASHSAQQAVAEMEQLGVDVHVCRADVSDEQAMRRVFAELADACPPLRGVIHAAGLPGYRPLAEMDTATLDAMFAAKVAGTWNLHQLTKDLDLDFFAGFSSMVSMWGAKGQSHYVAANHFLDVLTHYRRVLGLPALCVNWGPLTGGGMLPVEDVTELARIGVATSEIRNAVEILPRLLSSDIRQVAIVNIHWPLFKGVYESKGRYPLFELLESTTGDIARPMPQDRDAVTSRFRAAPLSERRDILMEHVQTVLARVLSLEASQLLDRRQGFYDMGLDSLTAMELKTELEKSLSVSLPATLAFDYATLDILVEYLMNEKLADRLSAATLPASDKLEAEVKQNPTGLTREMLERLSDDEVESLLIAKLESL